MTAATMDTGLLRDADGTAEYIQGKIDRCQRATAAIVCSFFILPKLYDIRRDLIDLRDRLGALEVSDDESRSFAREQAKSSMALAEKIELTEGKYKELIRTVWPIFHFVTGTNLRLLDEAYCLAEDAAETLALIGSKEFMESLEIDLRKIHGNAQG